MSFLLAKWQTKSKLGKIIRRFFSALAIAIFLLFLALPILSFFSFFNELKQIFKWIWIGCAVLNIDILKEYSKTKNDKILRPILSLFAILSLCYLYNYWNFLSIPIVVCSCVIVGVLEVVITIANTKTLKFYKKQNAKELSPTVIHCFVFSGLYICVVILLLLGIFTSKILQFVNGGLAIIFLTVSVFITISNGVSLKKNIINIVFFVIDIITLLTLIVYLIYLVPQDNNLQGVILSVVTAVIGGVLTLSGVAWTIKQTEKARKDDIERMENERKEEEKMKYRPLVFCLDPQHTTVRENLSVYFDNAISNKSIVIKNKGVQDFIVSQLFLRNADFSFSSLKGICVDDNLICFEIAQTLNKNQNYHILFNFGFCYKGKIEEFSLLLVDLLENYYILTTNFDIEGREIFVKSGIELIPVSIDFDNLKIIKRANAK